MRLHPRPRRRARRCRERNGAPGEDRGHNGAELQCCGRRGGGRWCWVRRPGRADDLGAGSACEACGRLRWVSRSGRPRDMALQEGWLTVEEAGSCRCRILPGCRSRGRERSSRSGWGEGELSRREETEPGTCCRCEGRGWRSGGQGWVACSRSRKDPNIGVEHGHRVATVCHLANISLRTGRKIRWDGQKEAILDDPQAMLVRPYRKPWEAVLSSLGVS